LLPLILAKHLNSFLPISVDFFLLDNKFQVKVLLSDGHITDGQIFLVDFHYNLAVIKVAADLAFLEAVQVKSNTHNGAVLALGRAYEGGTLMCSRGQIVNKTSNFRCLELLVSSCQVSMVPNTSYLIY
jgi:hypothetical protein